MIHKNVKLKNWILYLYTVLLLAINAIRIFSDSIWGDEGFSIRLASKNMDYLIERTARDVHPPLYYIILKFFYAIMEPSATVGRFVSFLPIVLVCIIALVYFQKRFSNIVAMIIIGVVTFTGNCVPMMVEIRMYTWGLFFVFANLLCINELLEEDKSKRTTWYWIAHCICSLLAAYTHYYALITVAIMDATLYVILFVRDKKSWKKSVLSMAAMVVGYLPWFFVLWKQMRGASQDYWIKNIDLKGYILYIFGDTKWGILLLLIFVVSIVVFYFTKEGFVFNSKEHKLVLICLLGSFGTIFVGTVVSVLIRPLYNERYILPALGLVAVALAISFTRSFRSKVAVFLLLVVMTASGTEEFIQVHTAEKSYLTEETKAYMADKLQEDDAIMSDNAMLSWTVFEYYFPNNTGYEIGQLEDAINAGHQRVWLMLEKDEAFLDKCKEAGFRVEKKEELGLDYVFFTLYLLER